MLDKARMACNRPRAAPPGYAKKSLVKACQGGRERIVGFGDRSMTIKKHLPAHRRSFRARHGCASARDKLSARYWSCKSW